MIKSFKCAETEKIFKGMYSKRLPRDMQRVALRKITQLNGSATLDFLRVPPGNMLEKLSGDRAGQWSIRINDQWRICFDWRDGNAHNVEIVDYH
jgi:proteic killer suppression protein